jgi:nucleotide-binding universal stress UspA family protein
VLQPDADLGFFDSDLPQEILFQAGGPVLFLPHIFRGIFKTRRLGIAWDGSRVAARALRDAMAFLSQEETVIITVNEARSAPGAAPADQLARHPARLGLEARIVSLSASRADIQPMILSLAADESLNLLVMGGYGHSRVQERVLGGITRAMSMTAPTLMSH